jgi:hypothetical protein
MAHKSILKQCSICLELCGITSEKGWLAAQGPHMCDVSEEPALQAGKKLPNRWREIPTQKTPPTHHEHEARWETPI